MNDCNQAFPCGQNDRLNLHCRAWEIDNGYLVETFDGQHSKTNFFSQSRVANIPLFISEVFAAAIETREIKT